VVIVIKDKEQVPLERFIFSIENMVQVEPFNKDTSVEDGMTSASLVQYFRSFLIRLNMVESHLGQMNLSDDVSFAVLLELKENAAPAVRNIKDLPPWIPAETQHTTSGASENAELYMIRVVNTGVVNLSLAVQESGEKLQRERETAKKIKQQTNIKPS